MKPHRKSSSTMEKQPLKKMTVLAAFAIAAICPCFTSCLKTCSCTDRNTGYIYPEIDYKEQGYKNCKKLQTAMNEAGETVYCERTSALY